MPYLIPNDWDGEGWRCVKLYWPNSFEWSTVLLGLLSSMSRGRNWDRGSGIIRDAQSIGWEIWNKNYPLNAIACNGGNGEIGAETVSPCGGGLVVGEDNMGQVVTDVTLENGVLYVWFGPCCKIEVGEISGASGPATTGVDPTTPSTWPCNKAYGMANNLDFVMSAGLPAMDVGYDLLLNFQAWRAALPQFQFADYSLTQAITVWMTDAAAINAEILTTEFPQYLACWWEGVMEPTDNLSETEFSAMKAALTGFSATTKSFISYIMDSLGVWTWQWWANQAHLIVGDCDCPEVSDYTGSVHFTGLFSALTPSEFTVEAHNNGKYIDVTWNAPSGPWQSDDDFQPGLLCDVGVSNVIFEVYPISGSNMPTKDWVAGASCPETDPLLWTDAWPDLIPLGSCIKTAIGAGSYTMEAPYGAPTSPTYVNCPVRKCGAGDDLPAETYTFRISVYSIDGVPQ